jgi:hypothetical protein
LLLGHQRCRCRPPPPRPFSLSTSPHVPQTRTPLPMLERVNCGRRHDPIRWSCNEACVLFLFSFSCQAWNTFMSCSSKN